MTRYLILAAFFIFFTLSKARAANDQLADGTEMATSHGKFAHADQGARSNPAQHAGKDTGHGPATKPPHMEELPHIHRFHRQRLRRMTVHHGKLWIFTQVLIILCHISILVIGYLHVTH